MPEGRPRIIANRTARSYLLVAVLGGLAVGASAAVSNAPRSSCSCAAFWCSTRCAAINCSGFSDLWRTATVRLNRARLAGLAARVARRTGWAASGRPESSANPAGSGSPRLSGPADQGRRSRPASIRPESSTPNPIRGGATRVCRSHQGSITAGRPRRAAVLWRSRPSYRSPLPPPAARREGLPRRSLPLPCYLSSLPARHSFLREVRWPTCAAPLQNPMSPIRNSAYLIRDQFYNDLTRWFYHPRPNRACQLTAGRRHRSSSPVVVWGPLRSWNARVNFPGPVRQPSRAPEGTISPAPRKPRLRAGRPVHIPSVASGRAPGRQSRRRTSTKPRCPR